MARLGVLEADTREEVRSASGGSALYRALAVAVLWEECPVTDIVERLRAGFFCREEAADEIERLRAALSAETERCAQIAISLGEFPGQKFIKEMRVMCGNAIADKIREDAPAVSPAQSTPIEKIEEHQ